VVDRIDNRVPGALRQIEPRHVHSSLACPPAARPASAALCSRLQKAWASAHGATHLELDTGLARKDAQRFYEQQQPIAKGYTYSWACDA
jgi:hypothetical protein